MCGIGVDCLGLVYCVGIDAGGVADPGEPGEAFGYYGKLPNPRRLVEGLDALLVRIEPADRRAGDVGAFAMAGDLPIHLAILAGVDGRETLIHADPRARPPRVVEHGFSPPWPERNRGWWRYPRLARTSSAGKR